MIAEANSGTSTGVTTQVAAKAKKTSVKPGAGTTTDVATAVTTTEVKDQIKV